MAAVGQRALITARQRSTILKEKQNSQEAQLRLRFIFLRYNRFRSHGKVYEIHGVTDVVNRILTFVPRLLGVSNVITTIQQAIDSLFVVSTR